MSTVTESELAGRPLPAAGCEGVRPHRPAWIEIDLARLRHNYEVINQDKPEALKILSVVKDDAYGHGALPVARTALEAGAAFLGLVTLEEAMRLRDHGLRAPDFALWRAPGSGVALVHRARPDCVRQ